ncbi:zinc-binding dehydrogenase [Microbacterium sp. 18062]|uniref:zinc-binding dehydrogenase n=1 Tax=Microbacterium sp. 18062 TaxID=2681410 RepID=UPI0013591685|nr:Zn-dependent alcohol dehydrogenase [Microbacterium sp. 18062]
MRTRASIVTALGAGFETEDLEIDDPIGREVLIEVKASGLCHSDLHAATTGLGFPFPAVFGHEIAGVVRSVGPETTGIVPGQHVVASLVQFCGDCAACRSDRTYQCERPAETGRGDGEAPRLRRADGQPVVAAFGTGGFSELCLVHENQVVVVSDDLPFPVAAILGCATITGAGAAINSAGVRVGDSVAVIGLGGVGLNVISGARLAGATTIVAIDAQEEKLALAPRFGATHTVHADGETDVVAAVQQITGGGVDHAFEVIGLASTTQDAIRMTRVGGAANLIGIHRPGSTIAVDPGDLLISQRTIRGIYMGSSNIKTDIPRYARLYQQGRLNLDDLIAREIALDDVAEAYEQLRSGTTARSVITDFAGR